ncbi:uncharacterized protein LOC118644438 [Monomorium pharaonis]|uniref:uncharacterized protein LOC118644438 n=1 Tax=Monomorium pharaonis TaxID=307658 RepID=UPI001747C3CD|nr:uncharacterized protein LOC118644438 [Monomorium pharaonis]
MDKNQNGFRRGRSCIDNLVRIVAEVEIGIKENKVPVAAFLDVSSAYDNVLRDILVGMLYKEGCPTRIVRYINEWMSNRIVSFVVNQEEEIKRHVYKGLPQGGVLSPILYALYTRYITRGLSYRVRTLQYADDIAIYTICDTEEESVELIEDTIKKIWNNLDSIGLSLAPEKTKCIRFNKNKEDNIIGLRIFNKILRSVDCVTFLGITIDSRLEFKQHLEKIEAKVAKGISILKYLNGISWGMEINTALMIYKGYIRSLMEYGIIVYYPRDWRSKEKMEKMQYKGVRTALGYRNSTPTNIMITEARVLRMEDRAGMIARNFWLKVCTYSNKELIGIMNRLEIIESRERFTRPRGRQDVLISSWRDFNKYRREIEWIGKYEIYCTKYEALTSKINIEIEIGKQRKDNKITDKELVEKYECKYELEKDYEIIYTDGSKQENRISVGIGIVVEERDEAYKVSIDNRCSIYTAEAIGIEMAVGWLIDNRIVRDTLILTDSKSVCEALENNSLRVNKNKHIYRIREKILQWKEMCKGKGIKEKKLVIGWIPSHEGIKGNEVADELAKEATNEEKDVRIKIPNQDWKPIFKAEMNDRTRWRMEAEGKYKGRKYFDKYYNKEESKPWFNKINIHRGMATMIGRLRANHYNLRESLARKGYIEDDTCECGMESQDIYHIVFRCTNYIDPREVLMRNLKKLKILEPYNLDEWISGTKIEALEEIWRFIKRIGKII